MRIEGPTGVVYRLSRRFVPTASQTASVLWAFRNASTLTAQLLQAKLQLLQVGAPTAALEDRFSLTVGRTYSAGDTTGGVAISPTSGKQDLTSGSGNVAQVTVHESNVAGGLTGGTKVLDSDPIARGSVWVPAAVPTATVQSPSLIFDYRPDAAGEIALLLPTNRGFVIACDNALGTASGVILQLDLMWTERP